MLRACVIGLAALALGACGHHESSGPAIPPAPHGDVAAPRVPPSADSHQPALAASVAGAWRSPANAARDAARHPVESLGFWGLRPGATVVEISPGGGYWAEIIAPYLAMTNGRYIAGHADIADPELSQRARDARAAFEKKLTDNAAVYGAASVVGFGKKSAPLGAPGSADLVLTARNIHNWMPAGYLDKALADFFAVLKPGGVLAVEEHRANAGPQDPKAQSGYVTEAFVIEAAQRAGFRLDGRSEINANPRDTKDHPFGVWTLPPVRRSAPFGQPANPAFDHTKYDAIGESDRMTLRFVKPQ